MRIYNEWLAEFCAGQPERFAGLAAIPSHSIEAAVDEIKRVAARGAARGVEIANTHDLKPLFHPDWYPVWEAVNVAKLPVHFHTIDTPKTDTEGICSAAAAAGICGEPHRFQYGDVTNPDGNHLRRRSRRLSEYKGRHRQIGHWLDSLYSGAHGSSVGGTVQ